MLSTSATSPSTNAASADGNDGTTFKTITPAAEEPSSSTLLDPVSSTPTPEGFGELSFEDPADESSSEHMQAGPFPPEVWSVVISNLNNTDLKSIRTVNLAFRDFATPHLFKCAYLSLTPENVANLCAWSRNEKLRKHVQVLFLDTTSVIPQVNEYIYAQWIAIYLEQIADLPPQTTGPLCPRNLLQVLQTDLSWSLDHSYLSGTARKDLISGFVQHATRGNFYTSMLQTDRIYKLLCTIFERFENIKHIESVTHWTRKTNARDLLRDYLKCHLPEKTLELIAGFKNRDCSPQAKEVSPLAQNHVAPGFSARVQHALAPSPIATTTARQSNVHHIISAVFRAVEVSGVKLNTLRVPGPDNLRCDPDVKARDGVMTMSPLIAYSDSDAPPAHNPAIATFKHLRRLELKIDYFHPGVHDIYNYDVRCDRLPKALQAMYRIEHLALGFQSDSRSSRCASDTRSETMTLYDLMLYEDVCVSEDEESEYEEDNDGPPIPFTPEHFVNALSTLFGNTSDTANEAGEPHPGPMPFTFSPNTNVGTGTSTQHGPVNVGILPIGLTSNFAAPAPKKPVPVQTADPIKPNPWPKLRYLELFNMPATQSQVSRLVRTVSNLKTLKMHNVYLHKEPTSKKRTSPHPVPNVLDSNEDDDLNSDLFPGSRSFDRSAEPRTLSQELEGHNNAIGSNDGITAAESGSASASATVDGTKKGSWYDAVEVISDSLRLSQCEMSFSSVDAGKLKEQVTKFVEGCEDIDIEDAVSRYLVEGHSMSLSLFVADLIREAMEPRAARLRVAKTKAANPHTIEDAETNSDSEGDEEYVPSSDEESDDEHEYDYDTEDPEDDKVVVLGTLDDGDFDDAESMPDLL